MLCCEEVPTNTKDIYWYVVGLHVIRGIGSCMVVSIPLGRWEVLYLTTTQHFSITSHPRASASIYCCAYIQFPSYPSSSSSQLVKPHEGELRCGVRSSTDRLEFEDSNGFFT